MGATACAEAAKCRVEVPEACGKPSTAAPAEQSSELFSKCKSQLSTIQLPIPEDGIFECLWEEDPETGELKEYTYVMENRDMPKTVLEEQRGDLSHRSCASDLERRAEFSEHKQKVERQRQDRSALKGPGKAPTGAARVMELQEQYRSLGINVVQK